MYQRTNLSNNLRIVSHPVKDRESVALGFWVGVGGRYEEDCIKGAAHFLEHIVFKGSKKYRRDQIKELIEGVGGTLNAFTSEEQTCYYAKIPAKHLEQTLDVLTDMVFEPTIASEEVAKEKTVIAEEIKMYHDLPQYYVLELFDGLVWPNHPLGKSLTGTQQSVGRIQKKDLGDFHRTHYTPGNVVVSACGAIDHARLVRLLQKRLGKLAGSRQSTFLKADNTQPQPRAHFFKKDTEQMHLALGMLGYDENNTDRYALSLLSIVLGGNMSSRLFNEVREKRGLAYSISSSTKSLHDTGVFMVHAGVDNQKIVETIEIVLKELAKVKSRGVTGDEFRRAKDYLKGQLLLALEDTLDHMLWIGETTISRDKFIPLAAVIKAIDQFAPKDLQRVAKEILQEEKLNLAVVGQVSSEQEKRLNELLGLG
ncbi:MAG: pitrilysin family protein [Candidatus Omnitrophota bacterium]|nr:pitrilysin family protein [Candidatus Omnitrophota bacterium]